MKKAIYPGSFDPITLGHIDILEKGLSVFDKILVCVMENSAKTYLFDMEKRLFLVKEAVKNMKNVEVYHFTGLTSDFAREHNTEIIIKGIRNTIDFEYEAQINYVNSSLGLKTFFVLPETKNLYISSNIVREMLKYKQDITNLLPKEIIKLI